MSPRPSTVDLQAALDLLRKHFKATPGQVSTQELVQKAVEQHLPRPVIEAAIWRLVEEGEIEFTPSWKLKKAS